MRCLILAMTVVTATSARALDVCSRYHNIHHKDVIPKILSGVPFKLLSVAADSQGTYRKIVRVDYDLWTEKVGVEVIGGTRQGSDLKGSEAVICQAISMPEVKGMSLLKYQLLLNPDLSDGLEKLHAKGVSRSGFLEINWKRLAKDLDSEKLLIESEVTP